jgi:hypothetical protein
MTPIVSRQGVNGLIEIGFEHGDYAATLDGKPVPHMSAAGIQSAEELLQSGSEYSRKLGAGLNQRGYTHVLGSVVGLYVAEVEQLRAAVAIDPVMLRRCRDSLTRDITYLLDAAHEDHVSSIERASSTGKYSKPVDRKDEIAKARAALAEFDAKHPEIVAAIENERRQSVERNMWN